jgi:TrmH family RNA methyltransferase
LKKIKSKNNPIIKKLKILQKKSSERKKNKRFIVEGLKEIEKAIKNGYEIKSLFISEYSLLLDSNNNNSLSKYLKNCFIVKSDLFKKICYRSNDNNIIGIIEAKNHNLNDLIIPEKPLNQMLIL